MKIRIDSDEIYPAYFDTDGTYGFEVEVSDEESAEFAAAWDAWDKAQAMIRKKLEEQGGYKGGIQQW